MISWCEIIIGRGAGVSSGEVNARELAVKF